MAERPKQIDARLKNIDERLDAGKYTQADKDENVIILKRYMTRKSKSAKTEKVVNDLYTYITTRDFPSAMNESAMNERTIRDTEDSEPVYRPSPCPHTIKPSVLIAELTDSETTTNPLVLEKEAEYKIYNEHCKKLKSELKSLKETDNSEFLKTIGLTKDAKLVDLLVDKILKPSDDWKTDIRTLVNISNDYGGKILKGGSYFEALFHLLFALNLYPMFSSNNLTFYDIIGYEKLKQFDGDYLYKQKVISAGGGSGVQGISDISFSVGKDEKIGDESYLCGKKPVSYVSKDTPYYFFSIKGFLKEKGVMNYDISPLFQQLEKFKSIDRSMKKICVGVRDKADFCAHLNRSHITFIKESLSIIIGYDEMMDLFEEYRNKFVAANGTIHDRNERLAVIQKLYPEKTQPRPILGQFFHQELITKAVIDRIVGNTETHKPHFLCVGVLPRGGKSYIAGGIIREHRKYLDKKRYNVLFLTSAVSETQSQFEDDLINKFADFHDIQFIDPRRRDNKIGTNNFVFISRQLASLKKESEDGSEIVEGMLEILKSKHIDLEYDIIFFDEAHIGILTPIQQNNLKTAFNAYRIPIVMLTATYSKPANLLDDKRDLFVWDLFDVKDMRNLPLLGPAALENIDKRFSGKAIELLHSKKVSHAEITQPYMRFPMPVFVSPTFSETTRKKLTEFSHSDFFAMDRNRALLENIEEWKSWHTVLKERSKALMLRSYLTIHDNESHDELKRSGIESIPNNSSVWYSIFRKAQKEKTRPIQGIPFSVLMFMPSYKNNPVGELCRAWASFLLQTPFWGDNFVALTLSPLVEGKEEGGRKHKKVTIETRCFDRGLCVREEVASQDLKKKITMIEREALKRNKGLLLVTGEVAKMGISLPCTDVVFLLDEGGAADDVIQKMFRSLTDSENKKYGFIVDLNLTRSVNALFEYKLEKDTITPSIVPSNKERIDELFNLCDWGYDTFIEESDDKLDFNAIMENIKDKIFSNLDILTISTKKLEDELFLSVLTNETYKSDFERMLKKSSKGKSKGEKYKRGEDLPGKKTAVAEKKEGVEEHDGVESKEKSKEDEELHDPKAFERNFKSMLITFINSLIVRNTGIRWNSHASLTDLLDTLKTDKESAAKPIRCDCTDETTCKTHENLYERVYCDIKDYVGNSEDTKRVVRKLIKFLKSQTRTKSWSSLQSYVDTFIEKLNNKEKIGGRRRTYKKKRTRK